MGWNQLRIRKADCPLLAGIADGSYVYFVHSYYCAPTDKSLVCATTEYGIEFCSMLWSGSVFATQFHPEKSQAVGLKMLENFVKLARSQESGVRSQNEPSSRRKTFQDLIVWQKAHRFALGIYRFTDGFPKMEVYGLTSQIAARRSLGCGEHRGRLQENWPSRQGAIYEHSTRIARGMPLLLNPGGGSWATARSSELNALLEEVSKLLDAYASAILASGS